MFASTTVKCTNQRDRSGISGYNIDATDPTMQQMLLVLEVKKKLCNFINGKKVSRLKAKK